MLTHRFLPGIFWGLLIRQVAVLGGDASGIVLQHAGEPGIAEIAAIEAGIVLVVSQTAQVREAGALEGELHGILVAEQILHGIDGVLLGVGGQVETELSVDISQLILQHCIVLIR